MLGEPPPMPTARGWWAMRCQLFSSDGPVMSEGSCEAGEGTITMVAERWHLTPMVGGAPLMLVLEDRHRYQVRVEAVHVAQSDAAAGPLESYTLTPLQAEDEEEGGGGLLDRLRHLFGR